MVGIKKIPYEHLPPRGYRKCSFCGNVTYTRRYKRKDVCKKCYAGRKNPESLYEKFHGSSPLRGRKVKYQSPPNKVIKIGRITQIRYKPEYPSKHEGIEYYHNMGDTGEEILESNAILATDPKGKWLYILKDKNTKRPFFSPRGVIG